jgi:hypothetical protein
MLRKLGALADPCVVDGAATTDVPVKPNSKTINAAANVLGIPCTPLSRARE